MKILVFDTETTGLKPTDRVIEVAAALYHTQTRALLWAFSSLVPGPTDNEAEKHNGITPAMLETAGGLYEPFEEIKYYIPFADAFAAHNVSFDRPRLAQHLDVTAKPWVDTMALKYPKERTGSRKLHHLAADHEICVSNSHRALGDVLTIIALLQRIGDLDDQLAAVVAEVDKPRGIYQALVSYDTREEAKSRGFTWDKVSQRWLKQLVIEYADAHIKPTSDRPFAIRRVQ